MKYRQTNTQQVTHSDIDEKGKFKRITKKFRVANSLCIFDGGNYPTQLCKKFKYKCKSEGKPVPIGLTIQNLQPKS